MANLREKFYSFLHALLSELMTVFSHKHCMCGTLQVEKRHKIQPTAPVKNSRQESQIGPSLILHVGGKQVPPHSVSFMSDTATSNEDLLCPLTCPLTGKATNVLLFEMHCNSSKCQAKGIIVNSPATFL